jgi:hypothetical protein
MRAQNEIESSPVRLHQSGFPQIKHGCRRLTRLYLESPICQAKTLFSQSLFTSRFVLLKAAELDSRSI